MQDYHKVAAWQKAHALALDVWTAVQRLPSRGCGDLKDQLIRASDSVASNIVEGCGAATNREFARYLDMAVKSCTELEWRCESVADRHLGDCAEWQAFAARAVEVRRMTFGLRRRVLESAANEEADDRRRRDRDRASGRKSPPGETAESRPAERPEQGRAKSPGRESGPPDS